MRSLGRSGARSFNSIVDHLKGYIVVDANVNDVPFNSIVDHQGEVRHMPIEALWWSLSIL